MVTALLFWHSPLKGALLFTCAYALGIFAALGMAFVFKRTILKGESKPLVLELPSYKLPSVRNALVMMIDRARLFIKKAGTVILAISIVLWFLATYPKSDPPPIATAMAQQAEALDATGETEQAIVILTEANRITNQQALANSFAGRMGRFIEPVIRPLWDLIGRSAWGWSAHSRPAK